MSENSDKIIGGRYEIVRPLNRYGETVLYLAKDLKDGRTVCIREFYSESIMIRGKDGVFTVKPGAEVKFKSLSMDFEELYNYLMSCPQGYPLIRPIDMAKANNTFYYIEEYVETESFDDYLARKNKISWVQLKRMITPIVKLLSKMHADGVYHRGISPETMLVTKEQTLMLSGFSIPAARTAESEIDSTLYFGYSSPEQYSSSSWQGSWSDVYSLAALCYRALTGVTPVEWRHRGEGRELAEPISLDPKIPQNVSDALMKALNVDLSHRYRQIEEFWCDLLVVSGGGTMTYQVPIVKRSSDIEVVEKKKTDLLKQPLIVALIALTFVSVFAVAFAYRIADIYILPPEANNKQVAANNNLQSDLDVPEPVIEETEIVIPSFIGTNIEKILLDPLYSNLFTFNIERVFSEVQPVGSVVAQHPKPGDPISDEKANIFLWVSKGSELALMPDIIGFSLEDACRTLEMWEIKYNISFVPAESTDGNLENGTILETSIIANDVVHRNSDVVEVMAAEVIESAEQMGENREYVYVSPPKVVQYWPQPDNEEQ